MVFGIDTKYTSMVPAIDSRIHSREPSPAPEDGSIDSLVQQVRQMYIEHAKAIGLLNSSAGKQTKDQIRAYHAEHRRERAQRKAKLVEDHGQRLLDHFAEGSEVKDEAIAAELVPVEAESEEADLFRMATLLWSIPVSRGYGRRMRFLVRDQSNGKLIGLLALGSPVFNLGPRDAWIGWTAQDRAERLVNVMDAFVVGAVPPYSALLGGKLVAALVGSAEVSSLFERRYGSREGIISGSVKSARLVLVTTTSALGRSSLYNRLKLPDLIQFHRLGMTEGWGHFHVPEPVFDKMRQLLSLEGHKYATGYSFGDGPNWRFRVAKAALKRVGLDEAELRHGIQREVYGVPLANNWREYLLGEDMDAELRRPSADIITGACKERWILPRSQRRPEFREWTRAATWHLITRAVEGRT